MTNKPSNETHQLHTGLSTLVVRLELDWEKLGEALARFSTRHDSLPNRASLEAQRPPMQCMPP